MILVTVGPRSFVTVALDPEVSRVSCGYYGISAEIPYYLRGKLLDIMGSNILSLIPFVIGDLHMFNSHGYTQAHITQVG